MDNWEIANFRVQERVKLGGDFIPEEDVKRRFFISQKNFWNVYRFLVDDWKLIYNGLDFKDIAKGSNDVYILIKEARFNKFIEEVNKK